MNLATRLAAVAALIFLGCGGKKDNNPSTGSGSAVAMSGSGSAGNAMTGSSMAGSAGTGSDSGSAMAGSGTMAAGSGSAAGSGAMDDPTMAHHAGMCPSTVFGSTTKAELKGKAIVVTVTADEATAITAIQKRATALAHERKDNLAPGTTADVHDQKGTHGGAKGLCPIYVPESGTIDVKTEAKGVVVTITPKDKPADLKTVIDGRIEKAADWVKTHEKAGDKGQGGTGSGNGPEGMNHSGSGDGLGKQRHEGSGGGTGGGGGMGTGGGGGKGTGGGSGGGSGHGSAH